MRPLCPCNPTKLSHHRFSKVYTVCFNIQIKCTESSETQELSVGPGEKVQQESPSMGGRAPGYPNSPDPHFQMVKRMLPPDWAQKCFVLWVEFANSNSWVLFVSLYITAIVLMTACLVLAHAPKECMQSGNFHFDISYPFQNTVYPKTKT